MKTKLRTVVLTLCLVVLMASMAVSVLGTEVTFTQAYVDSNQYSFITSGYKERDTKTIDVYISAIYKYDYSNSNYWRVYARATGSGTRTLVFKGEHNDVDLPEKSRKAGSYIALYLMGHDPSLDCRVTGYVNIH